MRLTAASISLVSINLCFIWVGLQTTFAEGIDGQGRLLTFILTVTLIANLLSNQNFVRQFIKKRSPASIWLIWLVYAVVNTSHQYTPTPRAGTVLFIITQLVIPFIVLTTVSSMRVDKIYTLLQSLQISLYIFFILVFLDANLTFGRVSLQRFDPNELSLYIYALISVICFNYFLGLQSYKKSLYLLMPVWAFSVLLGSRMGFAGASFLTLGFFLVNKSSAFSIKRIILFAPIAILLLTYVLNETALGERLVATTSQTENWDNNPAEGTVFQYYGDRGLYYILGWKAFLDSPIFGIGLQNFQGNYYYTVLHSEIMVQLSELGGIGFILYAAFFYSIIKNMLFKKRIEQRKPIYRYMWYPVLVLLFASTNLFLYKSLAVSLLFGLIILFSRADVAAYLGSRAHGALSGTPPFSPKLREAESSTSKKE